LGSLTKITEGEPSQKKGEDTKKKKNLTRTAQGFLGLCGKRALVVGGSVLEGVGGGRKESGSKKFRLGLKNPLQE